MRNRSRSAAKLTGAVGLLALVAAMLGLAPSSAGAADVPFEYVLLDGSEVVLSATGGDTEFPLFDPDNPTSAGVTGVIDDTTGDFEGDLVIPPRRTQQNVTTPVVGTIDLVVEVEADPIVGNVDPVTNEVQAATVIDVTMKFESLTLDADPGNPAPLPVDCVMADISMELSSTPDGEPFDPDANPTTFAVAGEGFEFPEPACAWNGTGTDPGAGTITLVRNGLIDRLELPNDNTTAFLSFESGTLTPPEPLPTTTLPPTTVAPATTVAPSTAPAQAVRAQPRVTG